MNREFFSGTAEQDAYAQRRGYADWETYTAVRELEEPIKTLSLVADLPTRGTPSIEPEKKINLVSDIKSAQEMEAERILAEQPAEYPQNVQAHEYYQAMPTAKEVVDRAERGEVKLNKISAENLANITGRDVPYYYETMEEQLTAASDTAAEFAFPVLLGIGIYSIFFA